MDGDDSWMHAPHVKAKALVEHVLQGYDLLVVIKGREERVMIAAPKR